MAIATETIDRSKPLTECQRRIVLTAIEVAIVRGGGDARVCAEAVLSAVTPVLIDALDSGYRQGLRDACEVANATFLAMACRGKKS